MSNRTAVVTGASRGIGRELAIGLAREGYRIALVSRSASDLEILAAEIRQLTAASIYPLDINDERAIRHAVRDILSSWGHIDVLINNAGLFEPGTIDVASETLDRLFTTNLRAPFCFMQEVLPRMRESKSGHIFNIASISGVEGFSGYGAYASSKFGLVGLSEAVFKEFARDGVKVTAICPSFVNTAMAKEAAAPVDGDLMIQPSDILKTVLWVLSLSGGATVSRVVINCTATVE